MFQVLFGDRFLKTHFFVKESPLEPTHLIKPAVPPRPPSARGAPPRPPRPSCGVPPPPPPPPAPLAPPPPVEKVEEQATVALFKEINSKGLDITQGYKSVALRVCVFACLSVVFRVHRQRRVQSPQLPRSQSLQHRVVPRHPHHQHQPEHHSHRHLGHLRPVQFQVHPKLITRPYLPQSTRVVILPKVDVI